MARPPKLLDEEVFLLAQKGLKELGKSGLVARKLQIIITARKHGMSKTCEFYSVTKNSLIKWIKDLRKESLQALQVQTGRGRKFLLNQEQEQEIKKWIEANASITINYLRLMILENMNIALSPATVHRLLQRLRFSYITPRPKHYKQNEKLKDEFKKKSGN
jgi:transposase